MKFPSPVPVQWIADLIGATLIGNKSGMATGINEIHRVEPGDLVFVDHPERGRLLLGQVDHLLETGANDVLVVKGNEDSIDRQERLIPYLPEQVVLNIDLTTQTMIVDWDPDF